MIALVLAALVSQPIATYDASGNLSSYRLRSGDVEIVGFYANGSVSFDEDLGVLGDCLTSGGSGGAPLWQTCVIGTAYQQVQDESVSLPERGAINFLGAGITCVDDTVRTNCTVSGGGGGGGGGSAGTTTVDFGAYPGDPVATVAITGQTGILSGSVVQAWIYPADTADHTLDEHRIVDMRITAHSIVAGTGFTITAFYVGSGLHDLMKGSAVRRGDYPPAQAERTSGLWSVAWRWQ